MRMRARAHDVAVPSGWRRVAAAAYTVSSLVRHCLLAAMPFVSATGLTMLKEMGCVAGLHRAACMSTQKGVDADLQSADGGGRQVLQGCTCVLVTKQWRLRATAAGARAAQRKGNQLVLASMLYSPPYLRTNLRGSAFSSSIFSVVDCHRKWLRRIIWSSPAGQRRARRGRAGQSWAGRFRMALQSAPTGMRAGDNRTQADSCRQVSTADFPYLQPLQF